MATSPFVLSQDANFNWQGTTGKQVKISVTSADPKVTLSAAYYPDDTKLAAVQDNAVQFPIAGKLNLLTVQTNYVVPARRWQLVEVGTDGSKQVLDTVDENDATFRTSVEIIGVA